MKVLFVTTSHDQMGDTTVKTGVWLEELAAPYYVFKEVGADITIASPKGGQVPLDPKSQGILIASRNTKRFLKDADAMNLLTHAEMLSEIDSDDFDAVFLPGGHGPLWDLANNEPVKELLEAFNRDGKPIGAVSHGVVGLISLQNEEGELLIKGKQLTSFCNKEVESSGLTAVVPFLLETKLLSLGALYSRGDIYVSHVVVDGNLITGQNAASAEEVAKKMVVLVKHTKQATTAF